MTDVTMDEQSRKIRALELPENYTWAGEAFTSKKYVAMKTT
jgi:hypothetical protein